MRLVRVLVSTVPGAEWLHHTYISVAYGMGSPVRACASSDNIPSLAENFERSPSNARTTRTGESACCRSVRSAPVIRAGIRQENLRWPKSIGSTRTLLRNMLADETASTCTTSRPSTRAERYALARLPGNSWCFHMPGRAPAPEASAQALVASSAPFAGTSGGGCSVPHAASRNTPMAARPRKPNPTNRTDAMVLVPLVVRPAHMQTHDRPSKLKKPRCVATAGLFGEFKLSHWHKASAGIRSRGACPRRTGWTCRWRQHRQRLYAGP